METYEQREQRENSFAWASSLDLKTLHWIVTVMASDLTYLSEPDRKGVLEVLALRLGAEVRGE